VLLFPENSVAVAMACTVLEEGDADGCWRRASDALGGRVAVIVRSIDVPWVVNLPQRAALKGDGHSQEMAKQGTVDDLLKKSSAV
jgi:hypothetical protein